MSPHQSDRIARAEEAAANAWADTQALHSAITAYRHVVPDAPLAQVIRYLCSIVKQPKHYL